MAAKIKAKRTSTISKAGKIPAKSPGSRSKSRVRADKGRTEQEGERSPA